MDSSDAPILLSPSFSSSLYVYRSTVAATTSEVSISVSFHESGDVPVSGAFAQYGSLSCINFPDSAFDCASRRGDDDCDYDLCSRKS